MLGLRLDEDVVVGLGLPVVVLAAVVDVGMVLVILGDVVGGTGYG